MEHPDLIRALRAIADNVEKRDAMKDNQGPGNAKVLRSPDTDRATTVPQEGATLAAGQMVSTTHALRREASNLRCRADGLAKLADILSHFETISGKGTDPMITQAITELLWRR